ncbi:uncharacterized protein [Procambarus clarkii]|uniref:uncharacterized protein isoform X2 n=1 Tax=Procambarus clarkii TaxID=6728 RepID=UPI0037434326
MVMMMVVMVHAVVVSMVTASLGTLVRVRRKAADLTQLWPDAVVPYTFLTPEPERATVMKGLAHWEEHTCLRFLPVNDTDLPHLQFRKLAGCRSGVGIEGATGQNISIGDNCNKVGIVVHEVGHAVGFYHEIRRPDRDDHVVVNENNILKNELFNFYKLHWLDISIKYDLSSVMHYHTLEWTANERTTVATRDPTLQGLIGLWKREYSMGLSHRDKLLANTIYGCLDAWLAKCNLNRNPCENEGYLGPSCTCVCPPGTSGRTCHLITGGYYDHLKSPCSLDVTYPTTITSPGYPNNYDPDTWCVYQVEAPMCQAPEVVVVDFQLGPRDSRDQCFHDYLEVRNDSLYDGFLKCGTEVAPGTSWKASSSTMILYFKGAEGGYRGFKVEVRFADIPGCCTTTSTSTTAVYLHTPSYPHPYTADFNCTFTLPMVAPARVVVKVVRKGGAHATHPWTCTLKLCQPNGRCYRYCRKLWRGSHLKVVLPNVASRHHLDYQAATSAFNAENAAYQVSFTLEESPCHKIMTVNRSDPRGRISVGPRLSDALQCEWWIQAPRGSHVTVRVEDLYLPGDKDFYLAVDEAGDASYPAPTTRVFYNLTLKQFVSLEHKLALVLQGDHLTHLTLKYELYECRDEDEECEYWAVGDECRRNPLWMMEHCRRSCLKCDYSTSCDDAHTDCQFWADHDQCLENHVWMNVHCRRACGYCEACWEANRLCPEWAALGECEDNPDYMRHYCRRSCGLCEDEETPTSPITLTEVETSTSGSTNTSSERPGPIRLPHHHKRKFPNGTRTTTTTPVGKHSSSKRPEENETTNKIETNMILKPMKGNRKPSKPNRSRYPQPPPRSHQPVERSRKYNSALDKKKPHRLKNKPLFSQFSKYNQSVELHAKKRTPKTRRYSNKTSEPFGGRGAIKQLNELTPLTTVAQLPTKTSNVSGDLAKKNYLRTTSQKPSIYTKNQGNPAPFRVDKVSPSAPTAGRVTPTSLTTDSLLPTADPIIPASIKVEKEAPASVLTDRRTQLPLTSVNRTQVSRKKAGDKNIAPPFQNSHSASLNASVEEAMRNSEVPGDPTTVYKSQGTYEEREESPRQSGPRRAVCGEGESRRRCESGRKRPPSPPESRNKKETLLSIYHKNHHRKNATWKRTNDVSPTVASRESGKNNLDNGVKNKRKISHKKHKSKERNTNGERGMEKRIRNRIKEKFKRKRGKWGGRPKRPGEGKEGKRDGGRNDDHRRRNRQRNGGDGSNRRSFNGRRRSDLHQRKREDATLKSDPSPGNILPKVTSSTRITHSPPTTHSIPTTHSTPTTYSPPTTHSNATTHSPPTTHSSPNWSPRLSNSTIYDNLLSTIPWSFLTSSTITLNVSRTITLPRQPERTIRVTPIRAITPTAGTTLTGGTTPTIWDVPTMKARPTASTGQRVEAPSLVVPAPHTSLPRARKGHRVRVEEPQHADLHTSGTTESQQEDEDLTTSQQPEEEDVPAPQDLHRNSVGTPARLLTDKNNKSSKHDLLTKRRRLASHRKDIRRLHEKRRRLSEPTVEETKQDTSAKVSRRQNYDQSESPKWLGDIHRVSLSPARRHQPQDSRNNNVSQRRNSHLPRTRQNQSISKRNRRPSHGFPTGPSSVTAYHLPQQTPSTRIHLIDDDFQDEAQLGKIHVSDQRPIQTHTDDQGTTEANVGDHGTTEAHVGDHGTTEAHVDDHGTTEAHVDDQDSTEAHVDDQDSTEAHVGDHGTTEAHVGDHGTTEAHVDDHGTTEAHVDDHGTTEAHVDDQGTTEAHVDDQGMTEAHVDDQGTTEAHVDDQDTIESRVDTTETHTDEEGRSETHINDERTAEGAPGFVQPPRRSHESYADWGVGPVRPQLYSLGRPPRPGWKFRRGFYRRDHIYEDIWPPSSPPRPLRDRGPSRTYAQRPPHSRHQRRRAVHKEAD